MFLTIELHAGVTWAPAEIFVGEGEAQTIAKKTSPPPPVPNR